MPCSAAIVALVKSILGSGKNGEVGGVVRGKRQSVDIVSCQPGRCRSPGDRCSGGEYENAVAGGSVEDVVTGVSRREYNSTDSSRYGHGVRIVPGGTGVAGVTDSLPVARCHITPMSIHHGCRFGTYLLPVVPAVSGSVDTAGIAGGEQGRGAFERQVRDPGRGRACLIWLWESAGQPAPGGAPVPGSEESPARGCENNVVSSETGGKSYVEDRFGFCSCQAIVGGVPVEAAIVGMEDTLAHVGVGGEPVVASGQDYAASGVVGRDCQRLHISGPGPEGGP